MLKLVPLFFKTPSPLFYQPLPFSGKNFGAGPAMKSPVTFKTKLYVTTVNNSFQPLPIFCHKELHLRCHIGLELNVVTSTKILKAIGGHHLHDQEKLTRLDTLKIHFQRFFCIKLSFLHLLYQMD